MFKKLCKYALLSFVHLSVYCNFANYVFINCSCTFAHSDVIIRTILYKYVLYVLWNYVKLLFEHMCMKFCSYLYYHLFRFYHEILFYDKCTFVHILLLILIYYANTCTISCFTIWKIFRLTIFVSASYKPVDRF